MGVHFLWSAKLDLMSFPNCCPEWLPWPFGIFMALFLFRIVEVILAPSTLINIEILQMLSIKRLIIYSWLILFLLFRKVKVHIFLKELQFRRMSKSVAAFMGTNCSQCNEPIKIVGFSVAFKHGKVAVKRLCMRERCND